MNLDPYFCKNGKGGGRKAGDGPLSMERNHMIEIGYIDNSRTPLVREEKREKEEPHKGLDSGHQRLNHLKRP